MEYPRDFSPQARARVEAERLKAGKELEEQRDEVPWSRYGPGTVDEKNLRKYILRVFLVFAQEVCELGSQRPWTVDRIRSVADGFLRRFTIEAYFDKGYDKHGRKLPEMICNSSGGILPKVQREFEKSAEWHQFEQELLAVAEQQARHSPQSSGEGKALILERLQVREEASAAQRVAEPDTQSIHSISPFTQRRSHEISSENSVGIRRTWRMNKAAQIIEELTRLRTEMRDESQYDILKNKYPESLAFQISERHPSLKESLRTIAGCRAIKSLGLEFAAKHCKVETSTMRGEWDHYKPTEYRTHRKKKHSIRKAKSRV